LQHPCDKLAAIARLHELQSVPKRVGDIYAQIALEWLVLDYPHTVHDTVVTRA
jgi:hypothetical protein